MTTPAIWSPLFHKSVADGAKIADCPAGADRGGIDHEPQLFTVNNLFNILQQTSVNAIMAVGMTLVILTSGIDLFRRLPAGAHRCGGSVDRWH